MLGMNELLFFTQTILIVSFVLGALKLGKEALIAWVAIQALVANLFVLKQISLFGFDVTASDAFAIGSLLGLNLLQEFYGKEEAHKATWICFFFMAFFTLVSQVHLLYLPSLYDTTQKAFLEILSASPRLLIASMCVFFVVQKMDIYLFSFFKNTFPNMNFAFRAGISLVISQFMDTLLFTLSGLSGFVASVVEVVIISFAIKLLVIFCSTTCLRWIRA
jgi:uncharacterized integral membrane protein (TIGR00697 family)